MTFLSLYIIDTAAAFRDAWTSLGKELGLTEFSPYRASVDEWASVLKLLQGKREYIHQFGDVSIRLIFTDGGQLYYRRLDRVMETDNNTFIHKKKRMTVILLN